MNPISKTLTLCTALILGCSSLSAQHSEFDPLGDSARSDLPRQVRVQVQYIEMSLEQMSTLMEDPKLNKSDIALHKRVIELTKKGEAKIIENQMLVARSGEKSTAESIQEFIYPTEYEPASPSSVTDSKETKTTTKTSATGPTPTAFETRNLGSTLEIEPTIGAENSYIDLRLAPELVYHVTNTAWAKWKTQHEEANTLMPIMYTLRLNTAATLRENKFSLLGALSPKNDQGVTDTSRKIMVFVKANVVYPGE